MSHNQFLSHPYTGTGILLHASLAGGMAGDSAGAVVGASGVIGNHVFETTQRKQELREAFDESLANTHLAAAAAPSLAPLAEDFAEKLCDALKQDLETGGAQCVCGRLERQCRGPNRAANHRDRDFARRCSIREKRFCSRSCKKSLDNLQTTG